MPRKRRTRRIRKDYGTVCVYCFHRVPQWRFVKEYFLCRDCARLLGRIPPTEEAKMGITVIDQDTLDLSEDLLEHLGKPTHIKLLTRGPDVFIAKTSNTKEGLVVVRAYSEPGPNQHLLWARVTSREAVIALKTLKPKLRYFDVVMERVKNVPVGHVRVSEPSQEFRDLVREYSAVSKEVATVEKRKETLRTRIKAELDKHLLGPNQVGIVGTDKDCFIERTIQQRREMNAAGVIQTFGLDAMLSMLQVRQGEWSKFREANDISQEQEEELTVKVTLVEYIRLRGY